MLDTQRISLKDSGVTMEEQNNAVQRLLDAANQEIQLYALMPRHARVYHYPAEPATEEKALLCLLSTGDGALDVADEAEGMQKVAAYRLAALSYKYAYLLRALGVKADFALTSEETIEAYAHRVVQPMLEAPDASGGG